MSVTTFEPGRRLVLSGGMPLGLFKGVRSFSLTPNTDGGTQFRMRVDYSGPLRGMVWRSLPDRATWFQRFASGLMEGAAREPG